VYVVDTAWEQGVTRQEVAAQCWKVASPVFCTVHRILLRWPYPAGWAGRDEKPKERDHSIELDIDERIILKWRYGLNKTGLRYVPETGSCEHGDGTSDCIKGGLFLDQLGNCQLLYKDDSVPHSYFVIILQTHRGFQPHKITCEIPFCLKMDVFWVVAPWSLVDVYRRFRGVFCLHYQGLTMF
jgi:hypothetical protein